MAIKPTNNYGSEQTWLEKYRREAWTFPFGSLMQAYGEIMASLITTGIKYEDGKFKKDAWELFELAKKMVNDTADTYEDKLKQTANPDDIEIMED